MKQSDVSVYQNTNNLVATKIVDAKKQSMIISKATAVNLKL